MKTKFSKFITLLFIILFGISCTEDVEESNPTTGSTKNKKEKSKSTKKLKPTEDKSEYVRSMLSENFVKLISSLDTNVFNGNISTKMNEFFIDPEDEDDCESSSNDDCDDFDIQEFEIDFPKILKLLFSNPKSNNNSQLVYTPDLNLCNQYLAKENPEDCRNILNRLKISHNLISSKDGSLAFNFDNNLTPLVITYSESNLDFEFNFNHFIDFVTEIETLEDANRLIRCAGIAIDSSQYEEERCEPSVPHLPVASGVILINLTNTLEDHIELNLSIKEMISIAKSEDDPSYDGESRFEIETADDALTLLLDDQNKITNLNILLNKIDLYFTDDEENNDKQYGGHLYLDGIASTINLDDIKRLIQIDNLNLVGDELLKLDFDNERALELSWNDISIELDANQDSLLATTLSQLSAFVEIFPTKKDDHEGSILLQMSNNTQIEIQEFWNKEFKGDSGDFDWYSRTLYKVLKGEVIFHGENDLSGDILAGPGDCFSGEEDNDGIEADPQNHMFFESIPTCSFNQDN